MMVNKSVENYIEQNPKKIVESVNKMFAQDQERMVKEMNEKNEKYIQENYETIVKNTPIIGNKEAKFTIIKFMDYNCGYCKVAHGIVNEVLKEYEGKVNLAVKELPILGPVSNDAAKLALAVYLMDAKAFEVLHEKLMAERKLDKEVLARLTKDLKVDQKELAAKINSKEVQDLIEANRKIASGLNLNGTPAFIVGKKFIGGLVSKEEFKKMIDEFFAGDSKVENTEEVEQKKEGSEAVQEAQ
jgi:protein-disulfide isomerase